MGLNRKRRSAKEKPGVGQDKSNWLGALWEPFPGLGKVAAILTVIGLLLGVLIKTDKLPDLRSVRWLTTWLNDVVNPSRDLDEEFELLKVYDKYGAMEKASTRIHSLAQANLKQVRERLAKPENARLVHYLDDAAPPARASVPEPLTKEIVVDLLRMMNSKKIGPGKVERDLKNSGIDFQLTERNIGDLATILDGHDKTNIIDFLKSQVSPLTFQRYRFLGNRPVCERTCNHYPMFKDPDDPASDLVCDNSIGFRPMFCEEEEREILSAKTRRGREIVFEFTIQNIAPSPKGDPTSIVSYEDMVPGDTWSELRQLAWEPRGSSTRRENSIRHHQSLRQVEVPSVSTTPLCRDKDTCWRLWNSTSKHEGFARPWEE